MTTIKNQPLNHHINVEFCKYNNLKDDLKDIKKALRSYSIQDKDSTIVVILLKNIVKLTNQISEIKSKYNF